MLKMRVSDDRYSRDRMRFDLALRMIRHEARTCTIRSWTGLSDDRIRKLYRTYLLHAPAVPVRRHRGKSPRQIAFFLRSPAVQFEATTLASLFCMLGLLSARSERTRRATPALNLESGEFFCQAYESYLALHLAPRVSFEHAWFLLLALLCGEELKLQTCRECGGLSLMEAFASTTATCARCARHSHAEHGSRAPQANGLMPVHRDWSSVVR
jgi:Flagellar transcriptional activator (FlhC)